MNKNFVPKSARLMDQVREVMRFYHYSYKTEKTYIHWILRYIRFNDRRHPKEMGKPEIERFLSNLAINRDVSASTQNLALNAILFLYKEVLKSPIQDEIRALRATRPKRLPTVLTKPEIAALFSYMPDKHRMMFQILYAGGLRMNELLELRVHDFDFNKQQLLIRHGKGGKDRTTLFPSMLHNDVKNHLIKVRELHDSDLKKGFGETKLPDSLARKYPNAAKAHGWQYAFPSTTICRDPRTGRSVRYHLHESALRKILKYAKDKAGINKHFTAHVFRHSFATHMLEDGVNIRTVQTLLGHKDVKTTEVYTHVMDKSISGVKSPLETLHTDQDN